MNTGKVNTSGIAPETLAFIRRHRRERAALARSGIARTIGCGHGFRKAAAFSSKAELLSLKVGEDHALYKALVFNGKVPGLRNGTELLPKYRKMLDKAQSVKH